MSLIPTSDVPLDEPFALNSLYITDHSPTKVNLGIGVYRGEDEQPYLLSAVQAAEKISLSNVDPFRHEYLAIKGDQKFLNLARDVCFDLSEDSSVHCDTARIVSVQAVSGTGANHVGASYVSQILKPRQVWLPNPTWGNHTTIWDMVGVKVRDYPYYDSTNNGFNFVGMMNRLRREAQKGDVLLLHACAHNPTGSDPSKQQWVEIADLCEVLGVLPFFDNAYQGFASGDISEDSWAIKHFFGRQTMELMVAQSFSKNFGLYGQRTGALHVVLTRDQIRNREKVLDHLCHIVRSEFSMAPRAGSDIVRRVLEDPKLREKWKEDLNHMSGRIRSMRTALYDELTLLSAPGRWRHIINQIGMFSYTGLSEKQVLALRECFHVYMLLSGRISMAGLNSNNITYVAKAIDYVVRTVD